ncbi:iron chaperone [Cohnella zeiphila]|uniref:DUF1801 domain-containing protein n=1 Tax=Cohnella zeiphila TaxID=2761120 RepID=A0A7X0SPD9_9BACL|nr:DUF1801 domain-containing protein [Cohnella zeiphila]MBB6733730.1 DUF1801 domain-containing protein [Cohnella zeiphila]
MKFETVDAYLASFPTDVQQTLRQIGSAIQEAVPEAEEVLSYQLPAFSYHGMLIYYSAYKDHYSISVPPPFSVFEVFKDKLAPYERSKTAVKFPANQAIPLELIKELASYKAKENEQKALSKKNKSKSKS